MSNLETIKEPIKKQPTLGKIIVEMKVRNLLNYISSCIVSCFSKKKKNTDSN
jgi:hypothetical protein